MPVSSLPADQLAVLELVLERGRSYDEIADLLGIDAHAVRARAHAAIDALGPNGTARLTTARRAELADYLLGQQDDEAAEATRDHLERSSKSRAWARVVAGELKPIGKEKLPEIPDGEGKATKVAAKRPAPPVDDDDDDDDSGDAPPSRPSLASAAPSSRLGGALLIAGVVLIALVLVVVIAKPFGGDKKSDKGTVSKTASTPTTPAAQPQVIGQINLTGATSKTVGIAQIVKQGTTQALVIAGQNLPSDKNTAYAVWLYNSATDTRRLGYAQPSAKAGRLEAIAPLPADASKFKELVISAESRQAATQGQGPKTPTKIVLRGKFADIQAAPAGGTQTTPGTGGTQTTPGTGGTQTTPGTGGGTP